MSTIVAWLYFAFNLIDTFLSDPCQLPQGNAYGGYGRTGFVLVLAPLVTTCMTLHKLTFLFIFKRVKLIPASWGCMRTKWNHIYLVATTAIYQIFLSPFRHKVGLFLSPLMIMQFTWFILLTSEHLKFSFQHRDFTVFETMAAPLSRVLDTVKRVSVDL